MIILICEIPYAGGLGGDKPHKRGDYYAKDKFIRFTFDNNYNT